MKETRKTGYNLMIRHLKIITGAQEFTSYNINIYKTIGIEGWLFEAGEQVWPG